MGIAGGKPHQWHINIEGAYRKEKKMMLDKMDVLDKKEEHTPLSI
jgi:hypothetical protein